MSALHEEIRRAAMGKRAGVSGWIRVNCLYCELTIGKPDTKQCMSVSARTGRVECWRCGTKTRLPNFDPGELGFLPDAVEDDSPQEITRPEHFFPLSSASARNSWACRPAYDYLLESIPQGRGLTEDLIHKTGIGCCVSGRYHGRVVIPVMDDEEAWLWWIGRSWTRKAQKPYIYPAGNRAGLLYNHRAIFQETDEPCGVVEGAFDAISLHPGAVALLGKPQEQQVWSLCEARRPLAVVQDGDAHQLGTALAMRLRFEGCRAGDVRLSPTRDPDEYDPDVLRAAMVECLSTEWPVELRWGPDTARKPNLSGQA